ncbi:hypothetical protein [Sinorhizobium terangae]|uniref:hypothetical protein n=1 Tax=Sinorhizobium terangae TaxID=110322 RepID=UPI0024B22E56|nr:hypothetical protein [Sinorhizobium terangae]WFU51362.1 hypothetical protein QA637_22625 [Sinorhizobium terangae]
MGTALTIGWLSDPTTLTFLFGALTIAFHSRKRVESLITPPRGEEFDFVRLLSLPAIVGKSVFRKAYLIYTVSLEILYFFMCASQPIIRVLAEGKLEGFEGPAWPLGAALIVIGVIPSTPLFAQIELSLRSMAHSVSNIPDEFFERVTKLSQSEIEAYVGRDPRYEPDLQRFRKIQSLALYAGCSREEADKVARRTVGAELFARWTINGQDIWSAGEFDKYRDILDVLRPKSESLKQEVKELVSKTSSSPVVRYIIEKSNTSPEVPIRDSDSQRIQSLSAEILANPASTFASLQQEDIRSYLTLADLWRAKATEIGTSNRRLSALFAIIALNDTRVMRAYLHPDQGARSLDVVLRELLLLVRRSRSKPRPWNNATLLSTFTAFLGCVILLTAYHKIHAVFLPGGLSVGPFEEAFFTSASLFTSFLAAGICALFIRTHKIDQGTWIAFSDIRSFPLSQYGGIVFAAMTCAFATAIIWVILYQWRYDSVTALLQIGQGGILVLTGYYAICSLIPAMYGVGICVVTDCVTESQERSEGLRLPLYCFAAIFIVIYVLLETSILIEPAYRATFLVSLVSKSLFSLIALVTFALSLQSNGQTRNHAALVGARPL